MKRNEKKHFYLFKGKSPKFSERHFQNRIIREWLKKIKNNQDYFTLQRGGGGPTPVLFLNIFVANFTLFE